MSFCTDRTVLEAAITAATAALGTDEVVEYTIGGTTVRKRATSEFLTGLIELHRYYDEKCREETATSGNRRARVAVPRGAV